MKHSQPILKIAGRVREKLHEKSSLHSRRLHEQIARMGDAVRSIEVLATTRSPLETEQKHLLRISESAKKLAASRAKAEDAIYSIMSEATDDLGAQIRQKANMIPGEHAAEIRTALRGMSEKDRQSALQSALEAGDGPFLAAITDAPAILSGVNPDVTGRFRENIESRNAPAEVAERDAVLEHFSAALTVLTSVDRAVTGFDNPEKIREIQDAEENFQRASGAFNDSVSD